jgi:hypothetical protein
VGANSHRIAADWSGLEPSPGQVNRLLLDRMRRLAAGFERAGGKVLVLLSYAPPWARDATGCPSCLGPPREDPAALAAWDRYVELVARAFPNAAAFEVWNEPNLDVTWFPRPDPERYTRLVKRTEKVLRRVAPRAKVLAGGLGASPDDRPPEGIMPTGEFLRRAFAAGLKGHYDAISWHAYSTREGDDLETLDADSYFRTSIADVQRAIDAGDPRTRQWVTEMGVSTSGPDPLSEEQQRDGLMRMLRLVTADERIDGIYLHKLFDGPSNKRREPEFGYGIVAPRRGGAVVPKRAFCALRRATGVSTPLPARGC